MYIYVRHVEGILIQVNIMYTSFLFVLAYYKTYGKTKLINGLLDHMSAYEEEIKHKNFHRKQKRSPLFDYGLINNLCLLQSFFIERIVYLENPYTTEKKWRGLVPLIKA